MNEKGFTLTEVIIAVALVGIMAVGFIPVITAQYINIQRSGDKSQVTYIALEDLEEQVSADSGEISATDPDATKIEITFGSDPTIEVDAKQIKAEASKSGTNTKTELKVAIPTKVVP